MPARKKRNGAAPRAAAPAANAAPVDRAKSYTHPDAEQVSRPEVGTQERFRDKKPPQAYRYDSSLAPELVWDAGGATVRERAEELLRVIDESVARAADGDADAAQVARGAARELRAMQAPFLNWSGKAERGSFEVPTLPLFVHERLSTQAILESVSGWKRDRQVDLFGDPQRPLAEQLRAYEHRDRWANRMILGDSLVVMNSLLQYEGMGGQVQMIYIDPPYGVKFGSNFQPFVRKRDVKHGDDVDLTREPEMVQAYRDTWELGLHSYLTYLRDRLLVARELLTESGSVFVQISDENLHHVREVMDEVFGSANFITCISVRKTGGATSETVSTITDYLLWYGREAVALKYRPLFVRTRMGEEGAEEYTNIELEDGSARRLTDDELLGRVELPERGRVFATIPAVSDGVRSNTTGTFSWNGIVFDSGPTRNWKTSIAGMLRLCEMGRIVPRPGVRIYKRYLEDFPYRKLNNVWMDVRGALGRLYVVQTSAQVIQRCMLMTTDPGD
jgi:adenine-specific DNA-methyltransferase